MTRMASIIVLTIILSACASSGSRSAGATSSPRSVITSQQIEAAGRNSVYEVVQHLRPEWLRSRGATSLSNTEASLPAVFLNNVRHGNLDVLRSMATSGVREIRYLTGPEATQLFGTGVSGGVIQVKVH
jgi:ABC-type phosphate transport system substrate-binding protein